MALRGLIKLLKYDTVGVEFPLTIFHLIILNSCILCFTKCTIPNFVYFLDITEPNIVIPPLSESDTYFAPISPAANTAASNVSVSAVSSSVTSGGNDARSGNGGSVGVKPTLLLEMLQRGGQTQAGQGDSALPPIIRAPSIRDLGKQLLFCECFSQVLMFLDLVLG